MSATLLLSDSLPSIEESDAGLINAEDVLASQDADSDTTDDFGGIESIPEVQECNLDSALDLASSGDVHDQLTDPNAFLSTLPESIRETVRAWRAKATELFGHSSKTLEYVDLMYATHGMQAAYADAKGEDYRRPEFIKLATDLLYHTTPVPKSMVQVGRWLSVVGLLELLRSEMKQGEKSLSFPGVRPGDDFFVGNFTITAMFAMAAMVRNEKSGYTADTWSWQPGVQDYARIMVSELRSGKRRASWSKTSADVKAFVERGKRETIANERRGLDPKKVEQLERQEQSAHLRKLDSAVVRASKALIDTANEAGISGEELRSRLISEGAIPALPTRSEITHFLSNPEDAAILATRLAKNGVSEGQFASMFASVENRNNAFSALARSATNHDALHLVQALADEFRRSGRPEHLGVISHLAAYAAKANKEISARVKPALKAG